MKAELKMRAACGFLLLAVFFLVGATGCAETMPGPAANRSAALALGFKPPAGKSGIYVIRQSGVVGAAVSWEILLDIDELGMLSMKHYLYATVAPGDHNLTMSVQANDGKLIHTEGDKNYFFVVSPGFSGGNFEQISEEQGRKLVTEMSEGK